LKKFSFDCSTFFFVKIFENLLYFFQCTAQKASAREDKAQKYCSAHRLLLIKNAEEATAEHKCTAGNCASILRRVMGEKNNFFNKVGTNYEIE
jgi:hypothetical protein